MSGETEKMPSGWTTDTLHEYLIVRLGDLRTMLDERYVTQTRAVEAAFASQQVAMQTALTAAEKAVAAALAASEKAVLKAELATEKRIEGLNELRRVVNDISALQMPRAEAEQRIAQVDSGLDDLKDRIARMESVKVGSREAEADSRAIAERQDAIKESIRQIDTRLTSREGERKGGKEQLTAIYALVGFLVTLLVLGGALAAGGVFGK